jgi:hypothetical protein
MIIYREIEQSYHHKPIVQGLTTPPYGVEQGGDVGEGGEVAEGNSGSGSPSNLLLATHSSLCFIFFVFLRCLLSEIPRGLFI